MARRQPTRLERAEVAFRRAGRRGLNRKELVAKFGRGYQSVVDELEAEGFLVIARPSKFPGDPKPWRYVVHPPVLDAPPVDLEPAPPPPAPAPDPQLQLPVRRDGAA